MSVNVPLRFDPFDRQNLLFYSRDKEIVSG